jgi:hypothetical protein
MHIIIFYDSGRVVVEMGKELDALEDLLWGCNGPRNNFLTSIACSRQTGSNSVVANIS